jgi:putative solute:sodium symporter small subunit
LVIWFVVSYGLGIIWSSRSTASMLGGYPLGFWFAQQGSIYVFLVLIFTYAIAMNRPRQEIRRRRGVRGATS